MENTHYVLVIGSMDACFVGPFGDAAAAKMFAEAQKTAKPGFDFYLMSEAERLANIAEHGDCPIQSPEAWIIAENDLGMI